MTLYAGVNSSDNPSYYSINTETFSFADPRREGYAFKGWFKESSYSSRVYSVNSGSTGNLTLYAKWEELPGYTIVFDANGGYGSMASLKNLKQGKSYKLPKSTMSWAGHAFSGWRCNGTFYKDEASVIDAGAPGETVTFEAVWKKDSTSITDLKIDSYSNTSITVDSGVVATLKAGSGYAIYEYTLFKDGKKVKTMQYDPYDAPASVSLGRLTSGNHTLKWTARDVYQNVTYKNGVPISTCRWGSYSYTRSITIKVN